jgi:alpha-L-fucosidase
MTGKLNARYGVLLLAALLWMPALAAAGEDESWNPETAEQRDERMAWWRDARFGMFIHWGLYAIPAGVWNDQPVPGIGEWIMDRANIPVEDYRKLAARFQPDKFDADQWARLAKEAGMKYVVITSKHHDGFCLFDSKATDWDVVDATPYGQDLLKPLAEACRKQGIKFCTYYSIMDWHHPSQQRGSEARYNPTKMLEGRKAEYIDYMKKQLRELIETCDTEVLWFDGEWPSWWEESDGRDLYLYLRELKPSLIVNNRVGKGRRGMEGLSSGDQEYAGDFGTPEQQIPATGLPGVDWESCMTMNDTWGFKRDDHNWKSEETLIRNLVDIASKGGNYLLNVGPTAEGEIPAPSVERLQAIGRWMKVNGESLYGTQASPFKQLPWGRCTKKSDAAGTTLYLHVFHWPGDGRLLVPGLKNAVKRAYLLADPEQAALKTSATDAGCVVHLPDAAPDKVCSVVAIQVQGDLEIDLTAAVQQPDGTIHLAATDATCHGSQIRYEAGEKRDNIGFWLNPSEWVEWQFRVDRPGDFAVSAVIAAEASGQFEIVVGDQRLSATAPATGDYGRFTSMDLGRLRIGSTGTTRLEVRAVPAGWQPMNLKSITLKPAG